MKFLKKHWSSILFVLFLILLIIPQTRMPIMVTVNRIISFSPSMQDAADQKHLESFSWVLRDVNGQMHNLEEAQGEVIVLNYWATWCPPCVAEIPDFENLYNAYKDRVRFYFITQDDVEKVEAFMNKHNYSMPVYYPQSQPPTNLQSNALPTTFFIDKSGKIVLEKTGAASWNSDKTRNILDQLLSD